MIIKCTRFFDAYGLCFSLSMCQKPWYTRGSKRQTEVYINGRKKRNERV